MAPLTLFIRGLARCGLLAGLLCAAGLRGGEAGVHETLYRVSISGGQEEEEKSATAFYDSVEKLGVGVFKVRHASLAASAAGVPGPALLLAFPATRPESHSSPVHRLYRPNPEAAEWTAAKDDRELAAGLWRCLRLASHGAVVSDQQLHSLVREAFFRETGSVVVVGISHNDAFVVCSACLGDGSGNTEMIELMLPQDLQGEVHLHRFSSASAGKGVRDAVEIGSYETWTVSADSNWRPPLRYQFLYRVACMGSTKMKYELGRRLIVEADEAARVEGLRWLRAAADDGHTDAQLAVAVVEQEGGRTDHDREFVRKHRCGPPSRLLNSR